jgi:hypothetical protein
VDSLAVSWELDPGRVLLEVDQRFTFGRQARTAARKAKAKPRVDGWRHLARLIPPPHQKPRDPWASPLSFAPSRYQPRMSRWTRTTSSASAELPTSRRTASWQLLGPDSHRATGSF